MLDEIDPNHVVVLSALGFLVLGCGALVYRLYRKRRSRKHTPWARLYDKELH